MTTPSKEGLKFSDEEREKADDYVEDLRNGGKGYWQIALDAVCRLNRAEELIRDVDSTLCACRYQDQPRCNCDIHAAHKLMRDFLTSLREEREGQ